MPARLDVFRVPSRAVAGLWFRARLAGTAVQAWNHPNLAVGIWYRDGPADSIEVKWSDTAHNIPKGNVFIWYKSAGTLDVEFQLNLPEPGEYTLAGLAGYFDVGRGVIYYSDIKHAIVEAYSLLVLASPFVGAAVGAAVGYAVGKGRGALAGALLGAPAAAGLAYLAGGR